MRACARSVDVLVSVLNVKCHASGEVQCNVVISVVIGICLIVLSVPLIVVHFVVPILILYQFIQLCSRSHSFIYFPLYSHGILGVVFTLPVGYSGPPSAVNDPTVTKQMNSRKSCLEEVSQLLVYQVALINQYLVRLHGYFRRNKESSSTKKKNFVPIVGFVELHLLFLSTSARETMLV